MGVPVGSPGFITSHNDRISDKLQECLERVSLLADSFSSFHILRSCLSACKVNHLLRALPYEHGNSLAASTKLKLVDSLTSLVGAPVSFSQWGLAALPVRLGGLGLHDPLTVHPGARISSIVATSVGAASFGLPSVEISHGEFLALSALEPACGTLVAALRSNMTLGISLSPEMNHDQLFDSWSSQHAWYSLQTEFSARILDETLPPRERKLRELFSGAHAGEWLTCPTPSFPAPPWSSSDWQSLLRWRLAPPLQLAEHCPLCGSAQDAFGDHVLCCKASGVYGRHNALRDKLADLLREAGFNCRTEVELPGTNRRPADVFAPVFPGASPMAFDTSVVHTLLPSRSASATVAAGVAAQSREESKVKELGEACARRSWGYTAFVGDNWCVGPRRPTHGSSPCASN